MHFSSAPLRWQAACGIYGVLTTAELGLVECATCRNVVARGEISGRRLSA